MSNEANYPCRLRRVDYGERRLRADRVNSETMHSQIRRRDRPGAPGMAQVYKRALLSGDSFLQRQSRLRFLSEWERWRPAIHRKSNSATAKAVFGHQLGSRR